MNSLVGKFTGIALLLAAGLLAALFAMGVFSATGVSALVVPADDPTTKAKENPRVEFSSRLPEDTGVTLTARFQVDADGAGDTPAGDDAIEITLPSFLTLLANTDQVTVKQIEPVADGNAVISVGQVESASGTDIVIDPDGTPAIPDTDPNDGIDDSVPMGPGIRAGFDVIVTVTGLTIAPTTATGATGNVVFNQEVGTTATDVANARNVAASSSIETLTPKISTNTPGAPVRLDIKSYADNDIRQGEDITVELKNFGVPSSIPESAVLITALTASTITAGLNPSPGPYVGSPDVVTVSGSKITMSLASRYQNGNSAGDISADSIYTVTFKQSAGITNPTTRGSKGITLKDRDTADGYGTVVIKSKVSLSSDFGPRGTSVTVTAKGIGKGGATVYLVQGDCADQGVDRLGNECLEEDSATYVDISLGTGTESGGVVSVDIDTTSSDFVRGVDQVDKNGNPTDSPYIRTDKLRGWNQITVVDGTGTTADVIAYFGVTPTISADEDSAQQGEELTILVEDWYYGAVGAVTIGDETATDVVPAIDSTGDGEIDIRVPNTARLGEQQLKVVGSFRNREGALNASGGIGSNCSELRGNEEFAAGQERV